MTTVLAFVAALAVGTWIGYVARRHDLVEAEARMVAIIKLWHSERVMLLEHGTKERGELISRIQAWDPNAYVQEKAKAEESRPLEKVEHSEFYTAEDLAALGLKENSDGGFIDVGTGALFETVDDFQEWTAMLRKKGIAQNVHPRSLNEKGV